MESWCHCLVTAAKMCRKLAETSVQMVEHTLAMKQLKDRTISGRLLWKLDMNNLQPLPSMVFSPPFYSSCPGYQVCRQQR